MPSITFNGGVRIAHLGRTVFFDSASSTTPGHLRLISHAHSDHVANTGRILATSPTVGLMKSVWEMRGKTTSVQYHELMKLENGLAVKPLNSGHVLGSAAFNIQGDGLSLTYTGDINTVETLTTQPAETCHSEFLVMESTYGHPSFVFPPRHQTYARILRWTLECLSDGVLPAFKAYSIGKSQELIKLFNTYTTLPVVAGPTVSKASKVYVDFGEKLDYMPYNDADAVKLLASGGCVYVDSQVRRMITHRRMRWAYVSGWALQYRFEDMDAAFPLSSHADYNGLLKYVEETEPRKVYVFHGFSGYFARTLRRLGFDAEPLGGR
ncbi:MAG: MBL fold metallo-hydrolase [Candidatus Caldarchaeum sp.]